MTTFVDSRVRGPVTDSRVNRHIDSRTSIQAGSIIELAEDTRELSLDERVSNIEKHLRDLAQHRDSRRGLEGPQGKQGEASTVPGPAGKDASIEDIRKVIFDILVLPEVRAAFQGQQGECGIRGEASTIPGPQGKQGERGEASTVPGPQGKQGERGEASTIPGPQGKDASIENIRKVVIEVLSLPEVRNTFRGERGERGIQGEASIVPGPQGVKGDSIEGPEGRPGKPAERAFIAEIVMEVLRRHRIIN